MPETDQHSWFALTESCLPIGEIYQWCVMPSCGAVVLFSGTVRDHADGRENVTQLEYQAYDEMVISRFSQIADEARRRWGEIGKIAIHHRLGVLELGESSVVVAVSSAHRDQAFEAGRFMIDALKSTAPIWKKEIWATGADWGTRAAEIVPVDSLAEHTDGQRMEGP